MVKNIIFNYINEKNNNYQLIFNNLNSYQEEYIKKKLFIKNLQEEINNLQQQTAVIEQNSQLKAKTLIYNYNIQLKKYNETVINFYKKQSIINYLNNNNDFIIEQLKQNPLNYKLEMEIKNKNTNKKQLTKNILSEIDKLW